jgi:hypothetical protein
MTGVPATRVSMEPSISRLPAPETQLLASAKRRFWSNGCMVFVSFSGQAPPARADGALP